MKLLCSQCGKQISRTAAQNRYYWKCIGILAEHCGYTPEQMSHAVKDYHGWYEDFYDRINNKTTRIYQSSADWDKLTFARNTEHLLRFADEQGVVIMTPEEYYQKKRSINRFSSRFTFY